ncbi:MAG: FAD:protein FMN transferase [Candidatus Promineifilaceae bacterium]
MSLWLETAESDTASAALAQAKALFEVNEQALSRFRPNSELSRLNARTGQWVVVSELLWGVLAQAMEMAARTHGRFDPTTLNALEHFGYTVSFEQLGQKSLESQSLTQSVPSHHESWTVIQKDEERHAVFLPAGVRLDLAGIAKGYTAQQAVELLRPFGPCLVDAGGDLAAGAAPRDYPGWPVSVSSPWMDEGIEPTDMFTLWLADEALATSGIDYRNWRQDDQLVHHIIDPASWAPAATDGLTATILADEAGQAEAWATATLVAGSVLGMEVLVEEDLAGLMVTQSGSVVVTPPMHRRLQSQFA